MSAGSPRPAPRGGVERNVTADPEATLDGELSRAVLAGDREAAARLFQRHFDPLYEFVHYRLGGDRARTEDVVQDTFLAALEGLAGFDGRSSLHGWLCGIAKNKIRALRRRRRPLALDEVLDSSSGDIDAILAQVASASLPDEALERAETRDLVGATLSSLPLDYRRALLAKYVEGRAVADIAREGSEGVKAVESRLHRARLAFARVFELLARRRGGLA